VEIVTANMTSKSASPQFDESLPVLALHTALLVMLAAIAGAFAAVVVLPLWLPGLSASLQGDQPKAYWYLSRASALVAYILLWLSVALGLSITNRLSRVWPGGPAAADVHQYASLLGLAFAVFHVLILMGDRYANYTLSQLLLPFASSTYRPLWVGLGQLGFYLMLPVAFSFYARKRIGYRAWRLIHYVSFAVTLLVLVHGVQSGTDTPTEWVRTLYWLTGGTLLFLTFYRVLVSRRLAK
jgi:predicted ferric reductase